MINCKITTLLGFDFGTKSIGVAVGQNITGTAYALPALKAKDGIPNWHQLKKLLQDWHPSYIVVGLPLNMDGTEQLLTVLTYKFINSLHSYFNVHIEVQDERLSTVEAKTNLFKVGGYKLLKKGKIDSNSAVIILQDWFAAAH